MILDFQGENRWLSNMYRLTIPLVYQNIEYWSVENFYVAMKTTDIEIRKHIATLDPISAKKFGRSLKIRSDWEQIKLNVMRDGLDFKFSQEPFMSKLIATGDQLIVEGNWWGDTFWGVCRGVGDNNLGKLIMEIRSDLCNQ